MWTNEYEWLSYNRWTIKFHISMKEMMVKKERKCNSAVDNVRYLSNTIGSALSAHTRKSTLEKAIGYEKHTQN